MNKKAVILEKATELLAASSTGDISTRAVCEAAGVTQPVLYRLFGDKGGLLTAVVDHVWDQYLGMKRDAERSSDPLADLYSGWDSHVAFAIQNPHAYRLVFGTALSPTSSSRAEAMRLLRENLERLAAQGRIRLTPADAARVVMAANSGVALALLLRPDEYPDTSISTVTREVVYRSILVEPPADAEETGAFVAATTLRSNLPGATRSGVFTSQESALLDQWLERIQTARRR